MGIRCGLHLPGRFMPVHENPANGSARTALLHRTASALRLRRLIDVPLLLAVQSAIAQGLALRATEDILDQVILELLACEAGSCFVASINHRDVGFGWFSPATKPRTLRSSRPYPLRGSALIRNERADSIRRPLPCQCPERFGTG